MQKGFTYFKILSGATTNKENHLIQINVKY